MTTVLRTQKEADAWLAEHVKIGECVEAIFAPIEPINLTRWIGAHECCSYCGAATLGLRVGKDGAPNEKCTECIETGMLVICWGASQTERWKRGERYGHTNDDGPQVGPIVIVGGVPEYADDLLAQAEAACVMSEDRRR